MNKNKIMNAIMLIISIMGLLAYYSITGSIDGNIKYLINIGLSANIGYHAMLCIGD